MLVRVDTAEIKKYILNNGLKQNFVAEKAGLQEQTFYDVMMGRRKLEAGEYASICNVLNVPFDKFIVE